MAQHNFTLDYWEEDGWLVGSSAKCRAFFRRRKPCRNSKRTFRKCMNCCSKARSCRANRYTRRDRACGMKRREFVEELHREGCFSASATERTTIFIIITKAEDRPPASPTMLASHTELTDFICAKVRKEFRITQAITTPRSSYENLGNEKLE